MRGDEDGRGSSYSAAGGWKIDGRASRRKKKSGKKEDAVAVGVLLMAGEGGAVLLCWTEDRPGMLWLHYGQREEGAERLLLTDLSAARKAQTAGVPDVVKWVAIDGWFYGE